MSDMTQMKLVDQEVARLKNLGRIANSRSIPIERVGEDLRTYTTAMEDNEISFIEVLTGIHPEVTELHFAACQEVNIPECICQEYMDARRGIQRGVALL